MITMKKIQVMMVAKSGKQYTKKIVSKYQVQQIYVLKKEFYIDFSQQFIALPL